jgi:outer membrane lipoprotein LolB
VALLRWRPGVALLVLLLAACAGQPPRAPDSSWEQHRARLDGLVSWSAQGKLALRTPKQSESASLDWHQHGVITRLELSGPLGVATTTLYSNGETLEVRRGEDTQSWKLDDTEALERSTGFRLPLRAMPHWLLGVPAPYFPVQDLQTGPDPALLQSLRQDDWEIHYEAYADFGEFTLPTRLRAEQGDTSVRLIIREWQVDTVQ